MFLTVIGAQEPSGGWVLAGQFGTIFHLRVFVMVPVIKWWWERVLFEPVEKDKEGV